MTCHKVKHVTYPTTTGLLGLTLIISTWINNLVMAWFTYRNINHLENRLSNCKCISDTKALWQGGLIGRQMRLNMVVTVITLPKAMYRRGHITKNAHHSVPLQLRLRIWGIYSWLFVNCTCLAILAWLIK